MNKNMANNDDKILKDAQYRKGLSIAYFNSINASIELAKVMFPEMDGVDVKAFITEYRDWFLEEHKKYYANVISKIGTNYDTKESIKKLESAKTLEDMQDVWRGFSEDERRDGEIRKVALALKKKYNEKA